MSTNSLKKIVVVGGGAGGLELVVRLCKLAKKVPLDITLIDKQLKHLWKPLLHEIAAGTFTTFQDEIDYISYAYQKGFKFVFGQLNQINRAEKFITTSLAIENAGVLSYSEHKIDYDFLILAAGSQVNDFNIPGVLEHCLLLNDLSKAELLHQKLINNIVLNTQTNDGSKIKINVVGGGATGVELAAELAYTLSRAFKYLKNFETQPFQINLIESSNRLLNMMPERISKSVTNYLNKNNIKVLTNTKIIKVTKEALETADGLCIDSSITVWAAGVKVNNLPFTDSLELNNINQFIVNEKLQTTLDNSIFAFGDCASCSQIDKDGIKYFVPPRAQAAHQQAKILAKSINNLIYNKPLLTYTYRDYGSLISLSHHNTVGVLMGRALKNFYIEGKLARFTYWLLYKKHLLIIKGARYVILSSLTDFLMKKGKPEIKLH